MNLAARITSVAPEGQLVATRTLAEAAPNRFAWTPAGRRPFKGIEGEVELMSLGRPGG